MGKSILNFSYGSKHQGSKKGYPHLHGAGFVTRVLVKGSRWKVAAFKGRGGPALPTNNQRVQAMRAKKMGLSLDKYCKEFCNKIASV